MSYMCYITCVWLLFAMSWLHLLLFLMYVITPCAQNAYTRNSRCLLFCEGLFTGPNCPGETMGKSQLNQVLLHSHHPIILASRVILTCDQASTLHLPTRQVYQTEAGKRQVISLVSIIIIPSHGLHHRLLLFYVTWCMVVMRTWCM